MGAGEVLSVQLRLMLTAGMLGDKTPFGLGLSLSPLVPVNPAFCRLHSA